MRALPRAAAVGDSPNSRRVAFDSDFASLEARVAELEVTLADVCAAARGAAAAAGSRARSKLPSRRNSYETVQATLSTATMSTASMGSTAVARLDSVKIAQSLEDMTNFFSRMQDLLEGPVDALNEEEVEDDIAAPPAPRRAILEQRFNGDGLEEFKVASPPRCRNYSDLPLLDSKLGVDGLKELRELIVQCVRENLPIGYGNPPTVAHPFRRPSLVDAGALPQDIGSTVLPLKSPSWLDRQTRPNPSTTSSSSPSNYPDGDGLVPPKIVINWTDGIFAPFESSRARSPASDPESRKGPASYTLGPRPKPVSRIRTGAVARQPEERTRSLSSSPRLRSSQRPFSPTNSFDARLRLQLVQTQAQWHQRAA